jgi:predicted secreted protein
MRHPKRSLRVRLSKKQKRWRLAKMLCVPLTVAALVALGKLALASSNFGSAAVWHPSASFRQSVLSACENRGANFDKCFAGQMKAAGASPEALAFTHALHDGGYMQAFRQVGQIAVASVMYPFRANENSALLIVNGEPAVVDVDALNTLPADQMKADPGYQAMLKEHSNATLWPGDRTSADNLLALAFADGSGEIVADYRVQAGCHACAVLGQAFFGFSFDPNANLTATKFTGFTAGYRGIHAVPQKIIRVNPNTTFTVLLPANRTTGYSWELVPAQGQSELQLLSHNYAPARSQIGSGGEERWSFRASRAGEYRLHFSYGRPWVKNAAPAKRLEIVVRVQQ